MAGYCTYEDRKILATLNGLYSLEKLSRHLSHRKKKNKSIRTHENDVEREIEPLSTAANCIHVYSIAPISLHCTALIRYAPGQTSGEPANLSCCIYVVGSQTDGVGSVVSAQSDK